MNRILIVCFLVISITARLHADTLGPSSYTYLNGNTPYGPAKFLDGGGKLTDGLYGDMTPGVSLGNADPSGWVEFGGVGEVQFTFASSVTITNIVLSMARWEPAAIYLPDTLKVNGSDYSGYGGTFNDQDRAFISLDGTWTGSDLTIYFSHTQYLFADEVSFQGAPVPEPSTWTLLAVAVPLFARRARTVKMQFPFNR